MPQHVILVAAKVGGIHANNTYPADFIAINLRIQTKVIDSSYRLFHKGLGLFMEVEILHLLVGMPFVLFGRNYKGFDSGPFKVLEGSNLVANSLRFWSSQAA
ncbi:NAD-dependent epimerase/dehydratase [Corchorus olitorius]|uniref:NAD-dependent epimerase/dehydratase n=1 Tax=Corchorus olitorius TaxID=93759 RepID=A0A1R3JP41_9ROSI|nr:NAD-dependent epimerase/dehydratase [Corchorus olitorius]